jgi:hypothetical protein
MILWIDETVGAKILVACFIVAVFVHSGVTSVFIVSVWIFMYPGIITSAPVFFDDPLTTAL